MIGTPLGMLLGHKVAAPVGTAFDPSAKGSAVTLSNSNLTASTTEHLGNNYAAYTTTTHNSGLRYIETTAYYGNAISNYQGGGGISTTNTNVTSAIGRSASQYAYYLEFSTSYKYSNASQTGFGVTYASGDVLMYAIDFTNGFIYVGKNGTWMNSGVPTSGASGTGAMFSIAAGTYYFGVTFETGTGGVSQSYVLNGSTPTYTPPTGYSLW